jgi:hypothetical protein
MVLVNVAILVVLAVGHKDGMVGLHDVENGQMFNSFTTSNPISSLNWTKMAEEKLVFVVSDLL